MQNNYLGCYTKLGRVTIGKNVFIGARTVSLCNVSIGDKVIVGTGSAVTHCLESDAVYAGNPAKKICSFEEYKRKQSDANSERPDLSQIRKWDDWGNASWKKARRIELLSDGVDIFNPEAERY